jgi:serine/threonine protein kinase
MLPGPEKIGPYVITGKIGSGGMATVYRAIHPKDQREVALKVLAVYLTDDEEVRRRFEREAHTLLQFQHPHILPVYDFGQDNGTLYLVMKLMSGRSLDDLLQGHPLPLEDVGRYTRQTASALDYAHARGIIHRDVKPANILLDDAGTPYLADFGVAYWTVEADSGARLTQAGAFLGTVAYASPEQCEGKKLDRPSDIYSLAVMVFEMATGRLPFESTSSLAVIKMHLRDAPPNPLAFNPRLPVTLYNVLVRALAKLPEARYPSAMKFSEAVDEALGLHVLPEPTGEDDWLYGDIRPISPDGPAAWTAPAADQPPPQPFSSSPATDQLPPQPAPADETPALIDPFAFDAQIDYNGPADPFADIEDSEIDEVVAHFSEFDDHFSFPLSDTGADFIDDFTDEAGIDLDDDFPLPSMVLAATPNPPPASPVIRPLRAAPPLEHPPEQSRALAHGAIPLRPGLVLVLVLVLTLLLVLAATTYAHRHHSPAELKATYRSDILGVTFELPGNWYTIPANVAVLSSTPTPTVLLSDQAVNPGGPYAGATIVIAVQHIDPVEVFGVPVGCENRVFAGPAQAFACMENRHFATPVYTLFDAPGSVRLPGTLPPTRASLPAVLLPTGQAQWLALVIVHWDKYDGAQEVLAQIARSVRPI